MAPLYVQRLKPLVVLIEEVANAALFEAEFITVMIGLQDVGYVVHSAIVSMQQYGDMEHEWRLVIVAIHKSLKETASEYVIPFGYFSDEVAYCAADIALPMEAIPKKYHRFMNDTSLTITDTRRGREVRCRRLGK